MHKIFIPLIFAAALTLPAAGQAQSGDVTHEEGMTEVEPAPSLDSTAPPPLVGGAVKKTTDGLCIEPGHPRYETNMADSRFPSMRACVASGGRRDIRQDPLSAPPTPTSTEAVEPAPQDPPQARQDDGAFSAWRDHLQFDDEGGTDLPGRGVAEGVADSAVQKPASPAIRPHGIELAATPSYSSPSTQSQTALEETCAKRGYQTCVRAFQAPAEYIGRSPRSFLP